MSKFLLLLGPSGVGKSSIIDELYRVDSRFRYISPFTTRELRKGETNKVHIEEEQMDAMAEKGAFLTINQIYGIRYATPKDSVLEELRNENFPIIDWPVNRMEVMHEAFPGQIYAVYILPPSKQILAERLRVDGRDTTGERLQKGVEELNAYENSEYEGLYDFAIISEDSQLESVAKAIYQKYIGSFN